jgi:hypothetical protein
LIPAGATIAVRTDEAIEAQPTDIGKTYSATIARDILDASGQMLIPEKSPAQLVVIGVEEGGKLRTDQVQLGLRSITVNGRTQMVQSETQVRGDEGLGANRRTAEHVGGGAALGALIGAVAGGGSGAAIGAAIGAAGGAAVQVLTKGDQVRVPAETVLSFRLDSPIRI